MREQARYWEASDKRSDPRGATGSPFDRLRTSLAEHSTEGQRRACSGREGGELRPKGPTRGKAKPGIAFQWKETGERL